MEGREISMLASNKTLAQYLFSLINNIGVHRVPEVQVIQTQRGNMDFPVLTTI